MTVLGCDDPVRTIDPFPIPVDQRTGALVAAASIDGADPIPVLVDTLSPVTVIDPGPTADIGRRRVELTLMAVDADGEPTVARARYSGTASFELHTCGDQDECRVGVDETTRAIGGIVGFDILGRSAVTVDFSRGQIELSPDIAGSNQRRRQACEAEFPSPFAGGGILRIGSDDEPFAGRRAAIRACLGPGEGLDSRAQGSDALLVAATGTPISLLSVSGYERYRASFSDAPAVSELTEVTAELGSGRMQLKVAEIPGMALVGQAQSELGACLELYANRVMAAGGCDALGLRDCPCRQNNNNTDQLFCRAEASVLLRHTVRFGILADDDPQLQALRDELRPALAEVDGLLSAADLANLRVAFDYPNGRILMRCENPGACVTRPVVVSATQAASLPELCPADPGPPDTVDAGIP